MKIKSLSKPHPSPTSPSFCLNMEDNMSVHSNESKNTTSPSFQLEINTLLTTLPPDDIEHEVNQASEEIKEIKC